MSCSGSDRVVSVLEAASSMGDVVMGWGEGSVLLRLNSAVMVTQTLRGLGLSRLRALWGVL